MRRAVALMGAALAVSFGGLVSGCSSECSCAAPYVVDDPASVAPGASMALDIEGLYGACCNAVQFPWQKGRADPLKSATLQLTDGNGEVLDEQVVDVADDASATVTLDVPSGASDFVYVRVDGLEIETIPVAEPS